MGDTVDVVITCYRQARTAEQALRSVLAQDAESEIASITIVDDGSGDGSLEKLQFLAAIDSRVSVIGRQNGGAAAARNTGIAAGSAPWVAMLDGDDLWEPSKLRKQLALDRVELGLVYTDFRTFCEGAPGNAESPSVKARSLPTAMPERLVTLYLKGASILPSSALVRRDALDVVGVFDTSYSTNEDPELWLRVVARWRVARVAEPLVWKRDVPGSLGSDLEAHLITQLRIGDEAALREPCLRGLEGRREAGVRARSARRYLEAGQRRPALFHLSRAIRLAPFRLSAWSYLTAALLPLPFAWASRVVSQLGWSRRGPISGEAGSRVLEGGRVNRSNRRMVLDRRFDDLRPLFMGTVLDIGGRRRGDFNEATTAASRWITVDVVKETSPDLLMDVADMAQVGDETIDVIKATELFEHVARPCAGLDECTRVLRSGGRMVLTVPFLHRIHGDPHDYQRWTRTKWLDEFASRGLDVEVCEVTGQVFTVLGDLLKALIRSLPRFARGPMRRVLFGPLGLLSRLDETAWVRRSPLLSSYHAGYLFVVRKG